MDEGDEGITSPPPRTFLDLAENICMITSKGLMGLPPKLVIESYKLEHRTCVLDMDKIEMIHEAPQYPGRYPRVVEWKRRAERLPSLPMWWHRRDPATNLARVGGILG